MYRHAIALTASLVCALVAGGQALGAPSITITNPKANDTLTLGQAVNITWTVEELTDVRIEFSPDNGATWDRLTDSVDDANDDWLSYPWTPAKPCAPCLIKIAGYNGEVPTTTGAFTVQAAGGDDKDDDGGCSVARAEMTASWVAGMLLLVVAARRRRRRILR